MTQRNGARWGEEEEEDINTEESEMKSCNERETQESFDKPMTQKKKKRNGVWWGEEEDERYNSGRKWREEEEKS